MSGLAARPLSDHQHAMPDLTHFDASGASRMVDVGGKTAARRTARASGRVHMAAETLRLIHERRAVKGDVLEVARLAGIMAAKRTPDLIPLCHPLAIDSVAVDFTSPDDRTLAIEATVQVEAKTGVEMEALTVVAIAALTVYDMCKSVDRGITIERVQLEEKSGGRSGHWLRDEP
jgi:cyclic pyranopterin phosphate synthase